MHPYRSSGLLPDRRNGFGDGLAVGVDEIVGTAVGLDLGVFVAMSELKSFFKQIYNSYLTEKYFHLSMF